MDFKQIFLESDIEYIFIEISISRFRKLNLDTLEEGKWLPSKKNGWSKRIDHANPQMNIKRHVHVARTKHISTKSKQVAWNDDGSRHDRKNFNQNISGIETAKEIAMAALGLPDSTIMEGFVEARYLKYLTESISEVEQSSIVGAICLFIE